MPINLNGNTITNASIGRYGESLRHIVSDGLLLNLDAGNRNSYSGTGTSWLDLSGNGRTSTLNGSPTFDGNSYSGGITTPANQTTSWIRLPETALQNLTNGTYWTLEWGMTMRSHSGTRYCQSMANNVTDNANLWQINASDMQVYAATLASGTNPTWTVNVPILLSLTRNGSTWRAYKNGVFAAQYTYDYQNQTTIQGWVLDQEQDGILSGFDANQNTNAEWYYNRLYNRVLTDAEILQNFNAIRGRFGL